MTYFIDVQGTLIDDVNRKPISGAIEFIDTLNKDNKDYIVITNNTKQDSLVFLSYLQSLGFNINKDNYLDPLMVLDEVISIKKIAVYGHPSFIEVIEQKGYELDYKTPEAILIGIKPDFTNEEFAQMIDFIINGAKLIGMHETSVYAKNNKRYPGVGAILKMLSYATGANYSVVGKPSIPFYKKAKELLKTKKDFTNITIISDDMKGDLLGAQYLGMKSVFVLSGKFKTKDEILPYLKKSDYPNMVMQNMAEVLKWYQKGEV